MLEGVQYVVCGTALCELAVAVQTDHLRGTVHIGLVGYETLTEVVGLPGLLQDFRLEIAQRGIVPARTGTVLVLDAGDRNLFYNCEDRFVGGCTFLLVCGIRSYRCQSEHGCN